MGDKGVFLHGYVVTTAEPDGDGGAVVSLENVLPEGLEAELVGVPEGWGCAVVLPRDRAITLGEVPGGPPRELASALSDPMAHRALDGTSVHLAAGELAAIGVRPGDSVVVSGSGDSIEVSSQREFEDLVRDNEDDLARSLGFEPSDPSSWPREIRAAVAEDDRRGRLERVRAEARTRGLPVEVGTHGSCAATWCPDKRPDDAAPEVIVVGDRGGTWHDMLGYGGERLPAATVRALLAKGTLPTGIVVTVVGAEHGYAASSGADAGGDGVSREARRLGHLLHAAEADAYGEASGPSQRVLCGIGHGATLALALLAGSPRFAGALVLVGLGDGEGGIGIGGCASMLSRVLAGNRALRVVLEGTREGRGRDGMGRLAGDVLASMPDAAPRLVVRHERDGVETRIADALETVLGR